MADPTPTLTPFHQVPVAPTGGKAAGAASAHGHVFDGLRRVCALCSDVNGIAAFCDSMITKIGSVPDDGSPLHRARTPSSASAPSSPATPSSRSHRKGFIVSPANRNKLLSPRSSNGAEAGGLAYHTGRRITQGDANAHFGETSDIAGHDVIVSDLMAMVEDLKLLSSQCLEHAVEIATKLTMKVCKDRLTRQNGGPGMMSGKREGMRNSMVAMSGPPSESTPPAPGGAPTADGARAVGRKSGMMRLSRIGGNGDAEALYPRIWAMELKTELFQPLASFCRTDKFCSENVLPRLVESCLHT